ncbi:MAG: DNA polymerase, partial [Elusimicrobiales bacterium]|nr:DNA polymerase [Elusimicrobiales bacterium]
KTINFGIIYGLTPIGLASELLIDRSMASQYIKSYFEIYPGVKKWSQEVVSFVRNNGYAVNFFGRRRYLNDINSKNKALKMASERMAINMPVQSGSSDIIKKAMVEIYKTFKNNEKVRLLLQIHDELLFEICRDEVFKIVPQIKEIMENIFSFDVPLEVNVKYGERWGELK